MIETTADVECYRNYFLVLFRKIEDASTIYFEKFEDSIFDKNSLIKILQKLRIITFNGNKYDVLMLEGLLSGFTNEMLYKMSKAIIEEQLWPWETRIRFGLPQMEINHIDLFPVAPLKAGLKLYAARIHAPIIQDLPIHHDKAIDEWDLELIREYCGYDNHDTALLRQKLKEEIQIRIELSKEYRIDLRSKSDAQIAEAIIRKEIEETYGVKVKRPSIKPGTEYYFECPEYIKFKTKQLKEILGIYKYEPFVVLPSGHVVLPPDLKNKKFTIGSTTYKIGIGGIHSCEKSLVNQTNKDFIIRDYDVASYYPSIIINNKLIPEHLGEIFLKVFTKLTNKRLEQKKIGQGNKLKIVINGTFGKLAEKFSIIYAPDLMMHVTVIGQLSLLMLIEEMESNGIGVISANTDGIVVKIPNNDWDLEIADEIIKKWEHNTKYVMESKEYLGLYSRDVNNYVAIYKDKGGKICAKTKGSSFSDSQSKDNILRMNPTGDICAEAVKEYLRIGKPIEETINKCKDVRRFIHVRTVKGGGVKGKKYLGKVVRWYYAENEKGCISYKSNGNKVATTDGAIPLMELPKDFSIPEDLDKEKYIQNSHKLLKSLGVKL